MRTGQEPRARVGVGEPWNSPEGEPAPSPLGVTGWVLVALRLPALALVVFGGLALLLALRLLERPLFGLRRPLTPFITQGVCLAVLAILGLRLEHWGRPMRRRGAIVANHASWLDIFVINALQRVYFVSKSEVAHWPVIGWLARATGTVFINRDAREARLQNEIFEARLRAGHHLCFFPEGTSTDGQRVLPFKPTLFAAFFAHGLNEILSIQPATLLYRAPEGEDSRFYGWWGSMEMLPHLLLVAGSRRRGQVTVVFHPPLAVAAHADRKALARACEAAVRACMEPRMEEADG
ncbi:MAG: 1-acyl-sn-glycerol-3-phosphate acyltransferase [Pararhodobacter sp.]|nr:1-acyl-sn-glycerol-3-phosphate acyltransferase [Pararhodobacter sp.]